MCAHIWTVSQNLKHFSFGFAIKKYSGLIGTKK